MAQVSVLGIDLAKQIFHVVGLDDAGNVVLRKRCPRGALLPLIAQMGIVNLRVSGKTSPTS